MAANGAHYYGRDAIPARIISSKEVAALPAAMIMEEREANYWPGLKINHRKKKRKGNTSAVEVREELAAAVGELEGRWSETVKGQLFPTAAVRHCATITSATVSGKSHFQA